MLVKKLLPILNFYPWIIPAIIVLGILSSLSEGIGISLFIPLLQTFQTTSLLDTDNFILVQINNLFANLSQDERLIIIAGLIFVSILLKNILTYINQVIFSWFNSRVSHKLRSGIFNQFLNVSYSFLEKQESGNLLNTLTTETWQTSSALNILVNLVINICTILVFLILMLLISWQLTLLVGVISILISITTQVATRQVKSIGQQAVEANKNLATRMWEGFYAMKIIRIFGRESYEQKRFDGVSQQVQDIFLKLDIVSGVVNPLSEVLSAALLMFILVVVLLQNQTALPSLLTFMFILHRLQPKIRQLDGARVGLNGLQTSVEEVISLLDTSDKPYINSGKTPFTQLVKNISFESVSFRYNSEDKYAVEDISICIPKGKTTALVGSSGAGKSTIISLLCRFYDPTAGKIRVDGVTLENLNLHDWRGQIAVVSQDIYMFSTTIRENIAYGRLDATEEEIIAAAKLANADEFINSFPYGYDTKVGDRGIRLSGGQRQRIALARAIVRDPEILILDEATNALDSIAENLIQEALKSLSHNRTVIAIAHRLSTIEEAEQIIVMDKGKVVEQGNLEHLLEVKGLFSQLYSLQNRNSEVLGN